MITQCPETASPFRLSGEQLSLEAGQQHGATLQRKCGA